MSLASDVYSGLAEVGFPLSVLSAAVTTLLCGSVIYVGMQIKKGLINPPPSVPGKTPMSPDQKGNLLIGMSVFLIAISWLWVWLAYRYKSIAAIAAIGSLLAMVTSVFHMRCSN